VELIAWGRTAEVFAWGDGRVLKLDRPEWNGLSTFEATVLALVVDAGVRAPRPYETITVDGRTGVVLERVDGPILAEAIDSADDVALLASAFSELQYALNEREIAGLSDLVVGLADGLRRSGLPPTLIDELLALLADLDDGRRTLCHFDLHAGNVIVSADGWVVIDWITASLGPPDADFARSLVLDRPDDRTARGRFMSVVEREGMNARGLDRSRLDAWIRVIAGARLAEGFVGEHADFLTALASGTKR
jgi:Ser/Thr protein kinase RdoA (MazF antagonist)